jgi:hypothetical protein
MRTGIGEYHTAIHFCPDLAAIVAQADQITFFTSSKLRHSRTK